MFAETLIKTYAEKTLISMFPGLSPEKVKWISREGKNLNVRFSWVGGLYEMEIGIDGKLISSEHPSDNTTPDVG